MFLSRGRHVTLLLWPIHKHSFYSFSRRSKVGVYMFVGTRRMYLRPNAEDWLWGIRFSFLLPKHSINAGLRGVLLQSLPTGYYCMILKMKQNIESKYGVLDALRGLQHTKEPLLINDINNAI